MAPEESPATPARGQPWWATMILALSILVAAGALLLIVLYVGAFILIVLWYLLIFLMFCAAYLWMSMSGGV